jgi:hypothetical protein
MPELFQIIAAFNFPKTFLTKSYGINTEIYLMVDAKIFRAEDGGSISSETLVTTYKSTRRCCLDQCFSTGAPPQGFRCATNFYKKLYIRT